MALLAGLAFAVGCSDDGGDDGGGTPAVTYQWSEFPAAELSNGLYSLWQMDTAGQDPTSTPFDGTCNDCPDPDAMDCKDDFSEIGKSYLHFNNENNFTTMMNLTDPMPSDGWITCKDYSGTYEYDSGTNTVTMTAADGSVSEMKLTFADTGGINSEVTKCAEVSTVTTPPADTETIREDCAFLGLIMNTLSSSK